VKLDRICAVQWKGNNIPWINRMHDFKRGIKGSREDSSPKRFG